MQTSMEKIAFGSDLEISAIDSKARIPIIIKSSLNRHPER